MTFRPGLVGNAGRWRPDSVVDLQRTPLAWLRPSICPARTAIGTVTGCMGTPVNSSSRKRCLRPRRSAAIRASVPSGRSSGSRCAAIAASTSIAKSGSTVAVESAGISAMHSEILRRTGSAHEDSSSNPVPGKKNGKGVTLAPGKSYRQVLMLELDSAQTQSRCCRIC
jgi:hypothetical protein